MLTSTPLPPESSESPESRSFAPRGRALPALTHAADATRRETHALLQPGITADPMSRKWSTQGVPEIQAPVTEVEAFNHEPVELAMTSVPSVAERSVRHAGQALEAPLPAALTPRESVATGVTTAALTTAALTTAVPAYNTVIGNTANIMLHGGVPSASHLGLTLGLPVAGAAAGYALGKKFRHPVLGTVAGTGAGMASTLWAFPLIENTSLNAAFTSMAATAATSSVLTTAGIAAGVGGVLYGLGRWHEKVRGSKPGGIFKTMARGVIAPASVTLGYLWNNRK